MGSDKIDTRHLFSKPFEVKLTYGEEDRVLGNSEYLVWYTDGSKDKGRHFIKTLTGTIIKSSLVWECCVSGKPNNFRLGTGAQGC